MRSLDQYVYHFTQSKTSDVVGGLPLSAETNCCYRFGSVTDINSAKTDIGDSMSAFGVTTDVI